MNSGKCAEECKPTFFVEAGNVVPNYRRALPGAPEAIKSCMSGNVIIFIAFLIMLGSFIGTQFGALITQYVRGISMRYVLVISILLCVVGSILKLLDLLLAVPAPWLQAGAVAVTFGGIGLVVAMIIALYIMAIRYSHGQPVPAWIESLVAKD